MGRFHRHADGTVHTHDHDHGPDGFGADGFGADGPVARAFARCEVVRDLDNGVDIPNEEQENDLRICRGRTAPWSTLWPSFQHYS
jgi:hypothetical protein